MEGLSSRVKRSLTAGVGGSCPAHHHDGVTRGGRKNTSLVHSHQKQLKHLRRRSRTGRTSKLVAHARTTGTRGEDTVRTVLEERTEIGQTKGFEETSFIFLVKKLFFPVFDVFP